MKTILVLGIGSYLARLILETGTALPRNVEVVDGGTAFHDLVPIMAGRDRIIIIDAFKIDDTPGSVYRFPAKHLKSPPEGGWFPSFSIHELLYQLDLAGLHPVVEIIGIVPEDTESIECGLSDLVERSIPKAIDEIIQAVGL